MRNRLIFLMYVMLIISVSPVSAWRKWEYINPSDVEIKLTLERPEVKAGEVATFTISIRNKTDKTLGINFPSGQHWDYAVFTKGLQIYRWSQGLFWSEANHSIPLRAGETMSEAMSWETIDRLGRPLPQGIYTIQGMVMVSPRHLVTNSRSIRLLPPEVKKEEIISTRIGQLFEIELPRYSDNKELIWNLDYINNDNRVAINKTYRVDDKVVVTFMAKRRGHVRINLYACLISKSREDSIERRSYRIEVK